MKVLRVYHAGRDCSHRERERALTRAGVEVILAVPSHWPGSDRLAPEPFDVVELPVDRPGDVNRHRWSSEALRALTDQLRPDVVDLHEEPFSAAVRQALKVLSPTQAVVAYTAQNLDKRFPPPFSHWERSALARLDGLYPCSRQAASVAVGKGFRGPVRVLPLGIDPVMTQGRQDPRDGVASLLLVGRLVPEKGVVDAVEALAIVRRYRAAALTIVGSGPEETVALRRASELGIRDLVRVVPWTDAADLADHYRAAHIFLAPSRSTRTWVEQFGRTIVEAHASGAVVVGYASGSLPDVVGEAGLLVAEGNVDALARAALSVLEEHNRWRTLRTAGIEAARNCTWESIAAGQIDLYQDAIASGSGLRRTRPDRRTAQIRFGEPAVIPGSARPFALPVLREQRTWTQRLEKLADRLDREPETVGPVSVVHLDHTATLSGAGISLERLVASRTVAQSHVILAEDGPLRARLESAGATVEVRPLPRHVLEVHQDGLNCTAGVASTLATARYVLRLARRLRDLKPDVIHTNSQKAGYYGSIAGRLARLPVVWHVRDRIADDNLSARAVRRTRLLLTYLPAVVVANSQEIARTTGVRARVVFDAYNPHDLAPRRGGEPSYVVGVVGRLSPWNGQGVAIRAIAEVPEVSLRIIGSALVGQDKYELALRLLVNESGVGDRVTFVKSAKDIVADLSAVDVVVHSSVVAEPSSRVVVEGMALGLPVVATNAGGPATIITDGIDGLLTTPGDVAGLADALRKLLDPDERIRLGEAALMRARNFSSDEGAPEMSTVWKDAIHVHGKKRRHRAPTGGPKIVMLGHTAKLSGGEIALERLVASGAAVNPLVILAEDGPLRPRLERAGATVEIMPLPRRVLELNREEVMGLAGASAALSTGLHIIRLSRRLRTLRPDVVHTNSLKAGYYGAVAARLAGLPVVWHVRDRIADDYMPPRAVTVTRWLLRHLPDEVVANSRATADTTGVSAWVIADPYQPKLLPVLRNTGTSYVIGVVGRIAPWKGQDVAVRALALLPNDISARFVGAPMFGEDDYAHSLRQLAEDLGVANRIVWVGFVDDVEDELARVDVVVHCSTVPEPFGQVVVEAMAAGRAVVAANAGGPAEIITHMVDGLLTEPSDVEALARALNILRDPAQRQRLGDAAEVRSHDFEPAKIAAAIAAVWRTVSGASSNPNIDRG